MIDLIERNREQIVALCKKHGVKRLELFGSAARGDDFDPKTSDVDFFYEFDLSTLDRLADRYFGLIEDLEMLLGRSVDLVSIRKSRNPYFLEVANRNRHSLYAA